MSGSRLLFKLSVCTLMIAVAFSFSGCEQIKEWTGQNGKKEEAPAKPKPQAPPQRPKVAKKKKEAPKPKPKPQKS